MKTLPAKITVWAVPQEAYERNDDNPGNFRFELRLGQEKHWRTGAVEVAHQNFEVDLPDIDPTLLCIEALEQAIKDERVDSAKRSAELHTKIASLLALEAPQ